MHPVMECSKQKVCCHVKETKFSQGKDLLGGLVKGLRHLKGRTKKRNKTDKEGNNDSVGLS